MENRSVCLFKRKTLDEINLDIEADILSQNNDSCLAITLTDQDIDRTLVKWTENQKRLVCKHFSDHIKNKKPPKKEECEQLIRQHQKLFGNKNWVKIKVYVQNIYTGKC
ncbi:hypothetical protein RN001_015593 [Aquatica leii]|uniref:Uncharacterized protein n=1 Tax=Aquatica leii TaxID=1421715 RepID=A0AAN7SAY6_9COLE|nr:hypothetical protein RN001_015593 [Aquatica leii]